MTALPTEQHPSKPVIWGAFVLGVAFSGFFDGILLHQVLQWHHLLSRVSGEAFRDLRVQVFADGMFHVLMYLVAVVGLWLLWRERSTLQQGGGGARFLGAFVLGFGAWNIADVALFHWVLRIHNIRLGVAQPLLWDVGWLVVLGLIPAVIGWAMLQGRAKGGGAAPTAPAVALVTVLAGAAGFVPPAQGTQVAVLFRPGMTDAAKFAAVESLEGSVVWADGSADLLVIDLPADANPWRFYGRGALVVGGAGPSGCLGRVKI